MNDLKHAKRVTTTQAERMLPYQQALTYIARTKGKKVAQSVSKPGNTTNQLLPVSIWVWKAVDPRTLKPPKARNEKIDYGTDVGVGEDLDHLSKRRQRARLEKIRSDVRLLKEMDAERQSITSTSS